MQCPQCHYLRSLQDTGPADACPRCGILYAKYDPAVATRRAELATAAAARLQRESLLDSARINAAEAAAMREHATPPSPTGCPSCDAWEDPAPAVAKSPAIEGLRWAFLVALAAGYGLWWVLAPG